LVKIILFSSIIIVIAVIITLFILKPWKEETIKIGAILSLTGATGAQGEDVRDGMLIAAEEINTWGGINGRRIELIIADSRTDPQVGIEAFKNLEAAHHPVFYVSMLSSVCIALAPLAETDKAPLIGLSTSAPKLTEQRKWVFRYWPLATNEVPPILVILQELNVRRLGLLYQSDEYGISILESIKDKFEKKNGKVIPRAFEIGETNYHDQRALEKRNLANKVYVVEDGEKALDYIFANGDFAFRNMEQTPKVILLDLKLPKVDGLEVLRRVKADERTRTIPVVVLTSSREERDMVEGYNLGVNSYIVKPVDFDNFLDSVGELGLYWLLLNQLPS
jgi:two-component system, response regulator